MPGCKRLVRKGEGRCPEHRRERERARWREAGHHLYKTGAWQIMREEAIRRQPVCASCGRLPSTVADHIEPHRSDEARFFDLDNVQALCVPCHNRKSGGERRKPKSHEKPWRNRTRDWRIDSSG